MMFSHGSQGKAVHQRGKQKFNYKQGLTENTFHKFSKIKCQNNSSYLATHIKGTN